ncbi:MAG: hypothetical protein GWP61_26855 [Chloroflexi bacterium]|jgi:hypothetical protein|nr:hypothetical protein [Chloroflexota bacterium]
MMKNQTPRTLRRLFILFQITFWPVFLTGLLATQINAQSDNAESEQIGTQVTVSDTVHLPVIYRLSLPPLPRPIRVTADPPIDFDAARTAAQSQGRDIAFNKIGFHVGIGGNREGLDEWMADLDAAGVPFFLKTANDAEPIYKAQQLMQTSGVSHTLVYRDARSKYDIPRYDLPPKEAAQLSWQLNRSVFPPELEPELIWIETVNEPDQLRAEWLAAFSLETAKLAVTDGHKYAAFGWSPGRPEPEDWESPAMLEFLRYAGEHPDKVAIALHEYSLERESIGNLYPWLVGRFQKLFAVCDEHDIPRPTVLITEWGWVYNHVPESVDEAMEDIEWASLLYAAYPQVKGAAIWYLGEGGDEFHSISDEAQRLITPTLDFGLSNYYFVDPNPLPIDESLFEPNPPT